MIKLENVHKSFGKNEVLKGINLHIEQGQVGCNHRSFWFW